MWQGSQTNITPYWYHSMACNCYCNCYCNCCCNRYCNHCVRSSPQAPGRARPSVAPATFTAHTSSGTQTAVCVYLAQALSAKPGRIRKTSVVFYEQLPPIWLATSCDPETQKQLITHFPFTVGRSSLVWLDLSFCLGHTVSWCNMMLLQSYLDVVHVLPK